MENKKVNIEADMKELDDIVTKISNPSINLNDSLELYEKAKVLIKEMEEYLNNAKKALNDDK
ncbi:MAG: exodeoxyribonuclease VII small subunit [Mollicutes bacterium]|nr:exodeoxyribonuclease VII small subunit [Mollicutes bacterium]MDD7263843.1 exodeoxyribonuclease VII small subunit [bacterium]MDY4979164.1 exodeoxyribonuclease VII small subunit [Candidatus Onthovivens sp.]